MSRRETTEILSDFSGGLNTSIGPLNNPGNTLSTAFNVEVGLDGSISNRKPFSILDSTTDPAIVVDQDGFNAAGVGANVSSLNTMSDVITDSNTEINGIDTFYWQSKDIQTLVIYGTNSVYGNFVLVASLYSYNGFVNFKPKCSLLCFKNKLYFKSVHFGDNDIYVPYRVTSSHLAQTRGFAVNYESGAMDNFFGLNYRDFIGVKTYDTSGSGVVPNDESRTYVTDFYLYNKLNGGWGKEDVTCVDNETGTSTLEEHPLLWSRIKNNTYPPLASNYESGKIKDTTNYKAIDAFSPWQLKRQKVSEYDIVLSGSVVLNLGGEGSRHTKISGIPTSFTSGESTIQTKLNNSSYSLSGYLNESEVDDIKFNCLAEIDGRMWYNFEGRGFNLAFSQIKRQSSTGWRTKCYQEADPTDDLTNNIVDTDGGTLSVTGLGVVKRFTKYGSNIVMFCDNGIWTLSGSETGSQFSPSSYTVSKVSSESIINDNMFCETPLGLFFLSESGLNVLSNSEGYLTVSNLSDNRVDDIVTDSISSDGSGSINFDKRSGRLYINTRNKEGPLGSMDTLVFDTKLNCFYQWEVYKPSTEVFSNSQPRLNRYKMPLTICSFNNIGTVCIAVSPNLEAADLFNYIGSEVYNVHNREGAFAQSGFTVYSQPDESDSYLYQELNDLGMSSRITYGELSTTVSGYNSYTCLANIDHPTNNFTTSKIMEDLQIVYSNDLIKGTPTSGEDGSGNNRFIKPEAYFKSTWDWGLIDNLETELQAFIKYPYQVNYDKSDTLIYNSRIPGKGRFLELKFYTKSSSYCTGFKIYGYSLRPSSSNK